LAYLSELHPVSMRRNPPDHPENPLLDLVFTDARSLETWYRSSLLSERNRKLAQLY